MTAPATPYDAIVLGAGAAGLMAAATAGQRGARVLVIDHAEQVGAKILISGGGRCNFTNRHCAPDRFLSANPHFAKSALGRYTAADFVALVGAHGIAWHEKTLGQLFCDGSAAAIVAMLRAECAKGGVAFALGQPITAVEHGDGRFRVATAAGIAIAPALVIATGGPSIPKLGATGFAYDLARRFGCKVVEPRPALVPLTLGGGEALFRDLAGVAAEVTASAGPAGAPGRGAAVPFREAALFTHRGLSGPAILQASSYWRPGGAVTIDFLPDRAADWLIAAKRARPRVHLRALLAEALPARLADALAERRGLAAELANLPDRALAAAGRQLAGWPFRPNGTEGFAKAEVTVGGIATDAFSGKTLAARHLPGLHAVGEALDVTGWLGGYNFQWAWASGWAAGTAIAAAG